MFDWARVDTECGHVRGAGRTDLLLPWLRAHVGGCAHPRWLAGHSDGRGEAARVRAATRHTVAHRDPTHSF